MSELTQGDPLTIHLGAPSDDVLVMNPEEGRKLDIWTQKKELNLYIDRDAFIEAASPYTQVTLSQENNYDKGALQVTKTLKKKMHNTDTVQPYRKLDNIFLKPL